jgi:urea transporter
LNSSLSVISYFITFEGVSHEQINIFLYFQIFIKLSAISTAFIKLLQAFFTSKTGQLIQSHFCTIFAVAGSIISWLAEANINKSIIDLSNFTFSIASILAFIAKSEEYSQSSTKYLVFTQVICSSIPCGKL